MSICCDCKKSFEAPKKIVDFVHSLTLSAPAYCHLCSWKRKMQWQNEYRVYQRSCSATGKTIVSIFHPKVDFPVYERNYWLSDQWMAPEMAYEKNRSFFEQYFELSKRAPRPHNNQVNTVNSEYAHLIFDSKDCYLSFQAFQCEDLLYCYRSNKLRNSMNAFFCSDSELLYETANCHNSYRLVFSQDCSSCNESAFLFDCRNCNNCFLSWNLRNKQYCFLNQQLSKEEYEVKMKEFDLSTTQGVQHAATLFLNNRAQFIKRANYRLNSEGCSGDFLVGSQNCEECYFTDESLDCVHVMRGTRMKDVYDSVVGGLCELNYNVLQPGWLYRSAYTSSCNHGSDLYFSEYCESCSECVGCIGLRGKKFCILNKQYSEQEYRALKEHIFTELIGGQGDSDFYDPSHSPFEYAETIAELYFPQTDRTYNLLPLFVSTASDLELQKGSSFLCGTCRKPFKVTTQEIAFIKKMGLVSSMDCFHCRIQRLSGPYSILNLVSTNCASCGQWVETSPANAGQKIFCEACYLKILY